MIVLRQLAPDDGRDRTAFTREQILVEYSTAASKIRDYPTLPQFGFGAQSRYGPWFIYMEWDKCIKFKEEWPQIMFFTGMEDSVPTEVTGAHPDQYGIR